MNASRHEDDAPNYGADETYEVSVAKSARMAEVNSYAEFKGIDRAEALAILINQGLSFTDVQWEEVADATTED